MLLEPSSRDVVVVAGLPGAGKTTLAAREPAAVDSDALRERWAPRLRPLPYALWRPLAHLWHWIVLWHALGRPAGVVVVRPFTAGWLRRAVLRRARRHHGSVHLVVVQATPEQARAGQRSRGRTVGERSMRRHERRWAEADLLAEGWSTVRAVARSQGATGQPAVVTSSRAPAESIVSTNVKRSLTPVTSKTRRTGREGRTRISRQPSAAQASRARSSACSPLESRNSSLRRSTVMVRGAVSNAFANAFESAGSTAMSNSPLSSMTVWAPSLAVAREKGRKVR